MNQQHITDAVRDWDRAMVMARAIREATPEFARNLQSREELLALANTMVIRNAILGVK